jgi:predicted permease
MEIVAPVFLLAAVGFAWVKLGFAVVVFAVVVPQLSTPVAITSCLIAGKSDADADAVAGLVVVSTLLSVVALPLTLEFVI